MTGSVISFLLLSSASVVIFSVLLIIEHCFTAQPIRKAFKKAFRTFMAGFILYAIGLVMLGTLIYTWNAAIDFNNASICNQSTLEGWCEHEHR